MWTDMDIRDVIEICPCDEHAFMRWRREWLGFWGEIADWFSDAPIREALAQHTKTRDE